MADAGGTFKVTRPSNFLFLREIDEELFRLGYLAERYFVDDPPTSIIKMRQFAEMVVARVCALKNVLVPRGIQFADLLDDVAYHLIPPEVMGMFQAIRNRGNRAAHGNQGSHASALDILRYAWRIGIWYHHQVKGDKTFFPPAFMTWGARPKPASTTTGAPPSTPGPTESPQSAPLRPSPARPDPQPLLATPRGPREYKLVFHEDFRKTLRHPALSHDWRRELVDCLRNLEAGLWTGGTRVKKLQGCDDLLEARINSGDRLLFSRATRSRLVIYDAVKHDDVERRYRRMSYTPDLAGAAKGDRIADPLDVLLSPADEAPSMDPTDIRPLEDPWKTRYSEGSIPRLFAPPEDVWRDAESLLAWSTDAGLDIDLLLTEEQAEISALTCAVLLSGSAGSGKTTVVVHSLLHHQVNNSDHRLLYVTYLPQLSRNAHDLYRRLCSARGFQGDRHPEFLTYDELCKRLLADAGRPLPKGELFLESHFASWLKKQKKVPGLTPTALWCEIKGVIKGRVKSWGQGRKERLLSLEEYTSLGTAAGSLPSEHREAVWQLAEKYERYLLENERTDEVDLARMAGGALLELRAKDASAWRYDALFCDEVQDLTTLQASLVELLQGEARVRLFLGGDEHQTIYPSAFRWSELIDLFRRIGQAHEVRQLGQNFRNSQPVLDLAYATLMGLKKRLLTPFRRNRDVRWEDVPTETHKGPPGVAPARLSLSEEELVGTLLALPPSAQRVVLVWDAQQRDQLLERLRKASQGVQPPADGAARTRVFEELVASIDEFKGLEADCVVLWNFFGAARDFWSAAKTRTPSDSPYDVLTECNRVYVALTRTHRYLALCDPPGATVPWDFDDYRDVRPAPREVSWLVDVQTQASSKDDFLRRARVLEESRAYRLALTCYRNGDDRVGAARCEALLAESEERWQDAGDLWRDARLWDSARQCYKRCGFTYGLLAVDAEELEGADLWADAASAWLRADEPSRAGAAYERGGDWERAHAAWKRCSEVLLKEFECRWVTSALTEHLPRLAQERDALSILLRTLREPDLIPMTMNEVTPL